jgi:hypothetical protein
MRAPTDEWCLQKYSTLKRSCLLKEGQPAANESRTRRRTNPRRKQLASLSPTPSPAAPLAFQRGRAYFHKAVVLARGLLLAGRASRRWKKEGRKKREGRESSGSSHLKVDGRLRRWREMFSMTRRRARAERAHSRGMRTDHSIFRFLVADLSKSGGAEEFGSAMARTRKVGDSDVLNATVAAPLRSTHHTFWLFVATPSTLPPHPDPSDAFRVLLLAPSRRPSASEAGKDP